MAEGQRHILYYYFGYPESSLHRGKGEREGTAFNDIMTRFVSIHRAIPHSLHFWVESDPEVAVYPSMNINAVI